MLWYYHLTWFLKSSVLFYRNNFTNFILCEFANFPSFFYVYSLLFVRFQELSFEWGLFEKWYTVAEPFCYDIFYRLLCFFKAPTSPTNTVVLHAKISIRWNPTSFAATKKLPFLFILGGFREVHALKTYEFETKSICLHIKRQETFRNFLGIHLYPFPHYFTWIYFVEWRLPALFLPKTLPFQFDEFF